MTENTRHELWVINAVDVPEDVRRQVSALLAPYDPDSYTRDCDASGKAID